MQIMIKIKLKVLNKKKLIVIKKLIIKAKLKNKIK